MLMDHCRISVGHLWKSDISRAWPESVFGPYWLKESTTYVYLHVHSSPRILCLKWQRFLCFLFLFFLFCFCVTVHSSFQCVYSPPSALNRTYYFFLYLYVLFYCHILSLHSCAFWCLTQDLRTLLGYLSAPWRQETIFSEVFGVNPLIPPWWEKKGKIFKFLWIGKGKVSLG